MNAMILKIVICAVLIDYATCRSARNYREMPDSTARLSQAQYPSYNIIAPDGPGTYAFGYEIEDIATGNVQFRDEEKLRNGTVRGSYGVLLPDNTLHITRYVADQFGYRAKSETRKGSGPLTLELQLQPSVAQQNAYPPRGQPNPNVFISSPSSTPIPEPFETVKPNIDPVLAASLYQSQQINLNPTYSALRDENVLDPQTANALLQQQYYQTQGPYVAFRQNSDGSVSTYQTNRPTQPWFNWFGTNNNNNQNYQSDQPQQGPILSFLSNLAQNNPVTNFLNGFQPQQTDLQTQNPIQNFFNNLNPFNLFSNNNNNRPQMSLPIQSDYVSTMSPSNHLLSGNLDSSVFNQVNDHFLNPTQFGQNGNYNPNYNPGFMNQVGLNSPQLQTTTYPSVGMPTPIYSSFNQFNRPSYNQPFSTVPNNVQPYSQYYNHHQNYPIYQNPYQTISPITVTRNPLFNQKKKTNNKNSKKKGNKNQVDIPDSESDWFQDFLDKRKSASLDVSSKRPAKKASDEEDDDLDDYFR